MRTWRRAARRLLPPGTRRRRVAGEALSTVARAARAVAPATARHVGPALRHALDLGHPGPARIALPTDPDPLVSVVVPVHGQWPLTAGCLASIAAEPPAVAFEVVVVDDASTDETGARLAEVAGVRAVTLPDNRGFVHAVNAGIDAARGRYVVLLNNDTVVRHGWLDALVGTAEADDAVGVVGAKLVYPDGRLQEAGGVIYRDGSGHNYGRDRDPGEPPFDFVRDVDYCSGACLLVRREVLDATGGLDIRFSPAYYEDTDLCFSARQLGYRVVYQPAAVVCHLEGASHGTDTGSGIKRYQVVNRELFRAKWRRELADQHPADPANQRLASWRTRGGRIAVIDHQVPMVDHDSGSRRMFELLSLLTDLGAGVTFCPQNDTATPSHRAALRSIGVEVLDGPPALDVYLKEMGGDLPLVICSRPTVAWASLPMLRTLVPDAKIVYDTVDLHFVREGLRADVEAAHGALEGAPPAARSAEFHRDMELTLARLTDATWVVSEGEAAVLAAEVPGIEVSVVPNIHPPRPPGPSFDERDGLLFVGSYSHGPNRDAARWLATDVLPLVQRRIPGVTLSLVGSYPTDDVLALEGEHVRVLGWVPDLEDLYRRSRLFVAPLRYGAGMKGKVGESLSYGLPVVTTPFGAEGMGLVDGRDVMVAPADDPEAVAAAVVSAYRDRALWDRLAGEGRRVVSERFSPAGVRRQVASAVARLGVDVDLG